MYILFKRNICVLDQFLTSYAGYQAMFSLLRLAFSNSITKTNPYFCMWLLFIYFVWALLFHLIHVPQCVFPGLLVFRFCFLWMVPVWASSDMFAGVYVQELCLCILSGENSWVVKYSKIQIYKVIPLWPYCVTLPSAGHRRILGPWSLHYSTPCHHFILKWVQLESHLSFMCIFPWKSVSSHVHWPYVFVQDTAKKVINTLQTKMCFSSNAHSWESHAQEAGSSLEQKWTKEMTSISLKTFQLPLWSLVSSLCLWQLLGHTVVFP